MTDAITRREALKKALGAAAGAAMTAGAYGAAAQPAASARPKRVIVAGGGIGGLSCAYELVRRGHDVTVLEAAGRPGGHVRTVRDPLADGFYAFNRACLIRRWRVPRPRVAAGATID